MAATVVGLLGSDGIIPVVVTAIELNDIDVAILGITLVGGTGETVSSITDGNGNTWIIVDQVDNGTDVLCAAYANVVTTGTTSLSITTGWAGEMITQVLELVPPVNATWLLDGSDIATSGTSDDLPYSAQTPSNDNEIWIAITNASGQNPSVLDPNPYEGWGSDLTQLINYNLDVGLAGIPYTAVSGLQLVSAPWQTIQFLLQYAPTGGGGAPDAPTLVQPSPALPYDYALGYDFRYIYNTNGAGPEEQFYFRTKLSSAGSYGYFDGTDFSSTTPVALTSANGLIEIPSGLYVDGNTYDWSVASIDAAGVGPFAPDQTLIATAGPAVSASALSVLSNDVDIAWSTSFGSGGSQALWRVVTYSQAQYSAGDFVPGSGPNLDDSGSQGSFETDYTLVTPIPNATVCRSYVFITQTPGLQVGSGLVDFTINNSTAPSTPTISAVLATDPTSGVPAIAITVFDPDLASDPAVGVIILRDDATSLSNANYSTPFPISGSVTLYDIEIATDTEYEYQAVTVDASGNYSQPSAFTGSVSVAGVTTYGPAIPAFYMWIPANPSVVLSLHLASKASNSAAIASGGDAVWVVDRPEDQGIFQPFGRKDSVVVRGDMRDEQFDLDLVFIGNADWNAFDNMRNQQKTVALRSDMSSTIGYYALGGTRPAAILRGDRRTNPIRQVTVTCTPVMKPT